MRPNTRIRRPDPVTAGVVLLVMTGTVIASLLHLAPLPWRVPSELHGRVTVADKPLTSAVVVLVGADGVPVVVPVDDAGQYRVTGIPPGSVQVGVQGRDASAIATARAKALARSQRLTDDDKRKTSEPVPELPQHVGDPAQSGLRVEVRGVTRFDIRLDP